MLKFKEIKIGKIKPQKIYLYIYFIFILLRRIFIKKFICKIYIYLYIYLKMLFLQLNYIFSVLYKNFLNLN